MHGVMPGPVSSYLSTRGAAVTGNGIVMVEPGAVFVGSLAFTGILETVETAQTDLAGVSSQIAGYNEFRHFMPQA
jgi:hypothetical protein